MNNTVEHDFVRRPHVTFLTLSIPVLFSLIAEPLTGLIDTGFVASLGSEPLAALGVGTSALSIFFWIFNFLGVGTQTEVAQAVGRDQHKQAARMNSLALAIALVLGIATVIIIYPFSVPLARMMGADGSLQSTAVEYMQIRIFGGPAVLLTMTAFGALRGLQDMRTPMWVATFVNALNIGLDYVLIFGWAIFPEMGVAGAALASTIAQWIGAIWAVAAVARHLPLTTTFSLSDAKRLFIIGGDMFVRTGSLILFLMLGTRVATLNGTATGAAHQAIRQVWIFFVFILEAYAVTGQSLVGFFVGAHDWKQAYKVAWLGCIWSAGTGLVLTLVMWVGQPFIAQWFVPAEAVAIFATAWFLVALIQPLNGIAFITDGIHWGTGDYSYLRNEMLTATLIAGSWLFLIPENSSNALLQIWAATMLWITIRSLLGVIRVWPGIGQTPWPKEPQISTFKQS